MESLEEQLKDENLDHETRAQLGEEFNRMGYPTSPGVVSMYQRKSACSEMSAARYTANLC